MPHLYSHSVCDLPLELQLQIASYLDFSDLWYLSTCSRTCQTLVRQIVLHKYHLDLAAIHPFEHLVHASMAYVRRDGVDTIHPVAARLATEIHAFCRGHCGPSFVSMLNTTLAIMLDHVLYDNARIDDPDAENMGQLVAECLMAMHSALTTLFDTQSAAAIFSILHQLLLSQTSRRLDAFTRPESPITLCTSRRHAFRVFIRFVGALAQTELLTVADLHALAQLRIARLSQPPAATLPVSCNNNNNNNNNKITHERWIEEAELRTIVLLDLLRAVLSRQQARWDSGKEMHQFATLVNQTVSTLVSFKTSSNPFPTTTTTTTC